MNALWLLSLLITVKLATSEGNKTRSVLPEAKNFKFEDEPNAQSYGLIRFEDQNRYQEFDGNKNAIEEGQKIKFEGETFEDQGYGFQQIQQQQYDQNVSDEKQRLKIKFEEDNRVNKIPNHQRKRRRRRPKRLPSGGQNAVPGYFGRPGFTGPTAYPGSTAYPDFPAFGPGPIYPGQIPYPPYPGPNFKPRPSATSAALTAVTEALTSIASYDDAQCVPRLLCEAAGGGGLPGSGLLQSVTGLQPLLTLLSAYSGISSSPLFVFGRAVFLGMTSKANPGTCRYAYPQCPNDPEQLVHYLNNHNGGFFRFFAAPELNQHQGLEQFYNQLSGQNYGLYQPQAPQNQNQNLQGYGQQNYQNQPLPYNQQFGQYPIPNQYLPQQSAHQNQNFQAGYGLQQQQYFNQNYYQRPGLYNGYGLYGQSYPHQKSLNQSLENKIQKRIQNVRNTAFVNNDSPKWLFPDNSATKRDTYENLRLGKVLKFPLGNVNSIAAADGFSFPGIQSNREYAVENIEAWDSSTFYQKPVEDFRFYKKDTAANNFNEGNSNNDGVRILYVVRGNGDPNNPEIVRLGPGQTL